MCVDHGVDQNYTNERSSHRNDFTPSLTYRFFPIWVAIFSSNITLVSRLQIEGVHEESNIPKYASTSSFTQAAFISIPNRCNNSQQTQNVPAKMIRVSQTARNAFRGRLQTPLRRRMFSGTPTDKLTVFQTSSFIKYTRETIRENKASIDEYTEYLDLLYEDLDTINVRRAEDLTKIHKLERKKKEEGPLGLSDRISTRRGSLEFIQKLIDFRLEERDWLMETIKALRKRNRYLQEAVDRKMCQSVFDEVGLGFPTLRQMDFHDLFPPEDPIDPFTNYPASPGTVRELRIASFVDYCAKEGYIDILKQQLTTHENEGAFSKSARHYMLTIQKTNNYPFNYLVTEALLTMLEKPNVLLPNNIVLDWDPLRTTLGIPDFALRSKNHEGSTFQPIIVGEYEGVGVSYTNLAATYCDKGCEDCDSQRHQRDSIIRQVYSYMVVNGVFVGIYTNYIQTFVFFRDCSGNLLITEPVPYNTEGDLPQKKLSVLQLVLLSVIISCKGEVPQFKGEGIDGLLVPCLDGHRDGPCAGRKKVPEANHAQYDAKREKHENKGTTPDTTFFAEDLTVDGKPLYLVDLQDPVYLRHWCMGQVIRVDIPLKSGNVDTVLKVLDLFKLQENVPGLQLEASIYRQLTSLQGGCIPKFVDIGMFKEGFLYGLGTVYSGDDVVGETLSEEFVEKAIESLAKIHAHGVLHGDLNKANILRDRDTGNPVFIDFGRAERADDMSPDAFKRYAEAERKELRDVLTKADMTI